MKRIVAIIGDYYQEWIQASLEQATQLLANTIEWVSGNKT